MKKSIYFYFFKDTLSDQNNHLKKSLKEAHETINKLGLMYLKIQNAKSDILKSLEHDDLLP